MAPSIPHEALSEVVREHPDLLVELLRRAGLRELPAYDRLFDDRADLGSVLPRELDADSLFRFERDGRTVFVVVFEVQRAVDGDKHYTWPAYTDGARLRYRCPVVLLVVAPDVSVADWARCPIVFGPGSGHLQPFVIGPAEIPAVDDLAEALRFPEWAVLSALAHARDEDAECAASVADLAMRAVFAAIEGDRAQLYYDYVWAALSQAARKALEMRPQNYEYQHEGLRRAKAEGLAAGKAEGLAAGKAEGLAAGKAEGLAAGKAEGLAEAVLDVFDARGILLTDAQRHRILAESNEDRLRAWLAAAVSAGSATEILGG